MYTLIRFLYLIAREILRFKSRCDRYIRYLICRNRKGPRTKIQLSTRRGFIGDPIAERVAHRLVVRAARRVPQERRNDLCPLNP